MGISQRDWNIIVSWAPTNLQARQPVKRHLSCSLFKYKSCDSCKLICIYFSIHSCAHSCFYCLQTFLPIQSSRSITFRSFEDVSDTHVPPVPTDLSNREPTGSEWNNLKSTAGQAEGEAPCKGQTACNSIVPVFCWSPKLIPFGWQTRISEVFRHTRSPKSVCTDM